MADDDELEKLRKQVRRRQEEQQREIDELRERWAQRTATARDRARSTNQKLEAGFEETLPKSGPGARKTEADS